MKYRRGGVLYEANRFEHPATAPLGVFTREDGSAYVLKLDNSTVDVRPGDWVVIIPGVEVGVRCVVVPDEDFGELYEPVEEAVWIPITTSSNVSGYGYVETLMQLEVEFGGVSRYRYLGVPKQIFEGLKEAKSKGGFLIENVKNKFLFEKGDTKKVT
mgnify:CR=1 FL=1